MAAIPWSLINTFAIPIGLWVIRNGLAYYRSLRASYNRQKPSIRPLPPQASRVLNILFVFALVAFISTLPYFSPPNIFTLTNSRVQTTTEVIFNRLAALRPLSKTEEILNTKFTSRDLRLLYLQYGPEVVAGCPFCSSSQPYSFLIYALPTILAPHIAHLAILGIVTSNFFGGAECARWRTLATIAGIVVPLADVYLNSSYEPALNLRSTQTKNIDFHYWKMRLARSLAVVAVDMVLALVIWLSSTNRLFVREVTLSDRLELIGQATEKTNFRLWAAGNIRNAVVRDKSLRDRSAQYWAEESRIYEEREVVDGVRGALSNIDMNQLSQAAEQKADQIIGAGQMPAI